jgi:hypothetical protein
MTPDEMIHAWANARSDSQRKVIERKITEENARRRKLAEEQQKNSIPVSKKLKQKRSKIPEVEIANLMEKLFKAKTPEEADDIAKQIGRKEKKKYLKKNQSKIEEESMKRWEEEAARWKKQQEEAKEVDMSEDVSDEQIAELMVKMMKASREDVPKIAEQIQVMLRKQDSKANKRSNSRARATKREADDASGEEETAANKR